MRTCGNAAVAGVHRYLIVTRDALIAIMLDVETVQ